MIALRRLSGLSASARWVFSVALLQTAGDLRPLHIFLLLIPALRRLSGLSAERPLGFFCRFAPNRRRYSTASHFFAPDDRKSPESLFIPAKPVRIRHP
jgi:hypothetical protein